MPDLEYNDDQEQSEVFDEDNQNLDGEGQISPMDMRTLEELPDVLDVTAVESDDDDEVMTAGEDEEDYAELPVFDRALADEGPIEAAADDEVELIDGGDLNEVPFEVRGEMASFEADTLDDDDLEDLDYAERGPDGEARAR